MHGIFLVLGACVLWAIDTLIRYPLVAENGYDAFAIVFYEHLILSVIFFVIFSKAIKQLWNSGKLSHLSYFFVIGGVGSALGTLAFTKAFTILNPSLVILLQKFQPVVAIILARVVLKESISSKFILWAMVCIFGAFLISIEDIRGLLRLESSFLDLVFQEGLVQGYALVLFSVVGWGAATVFGKKLLQEGYSDEQLLAGRFVMGFICLLPFIFLSESLFSHKVEVYGKVSLMVLVSGLLAMYLYYQGLRKLSARACSLTEMFFPFMAVLVNWLFLGASLSPIQLVGGGILLVGSLVIQLKHY